MTEAIIRKYYADLVELLPMNNVKFRSKLYSADLFHGDLWNEVLSKPTAAEKAEHFLLYGIKNDTDSFSKLLTIMEGYDDDHLKKLTEMIYGESDLQHPLLKKRMLDIAILGHAQNKLKTAYNHICNSDDPHCYIQLVLVRDEICNIHDKRLNEITRHTLQGQVDEILKIKEPLKRGLEDIFHYNDSPCPRLILILGAPGIGKTTLANEICLKWANDKDCYLSNDYDLIILIRLRAIQERTLQQAMIEAVGSEAAYDELLTKSNGERCLIILEGLDEISTQWQQNDTMFCQLVKNTVFLSYANILITSRPHACIGLHMDIKGYARTIEIVGFDKPKIKERAKLYFQSSDTAEKFMEQMNRNPAISSLCYVPLCLNMVLDSFKYNNETLHTTLTELYQSFIMSKVDNHIRFKKAVSLGTVLECDEKYFKNVSAILSSVPNVLCKKTMETVFLLSKLAYKSYFEWYEQKIESGNTDVTDEYSGTNPKIIYTNINLTQCNIINIENDACGLLKATNTLFATSNTAVYSFNHLSVQEYFFALYISLLSEDQQLQLLKDNLIEYQYIWPFYAGITKLTQSDVSHYLLKFLLQNKQLVGTKLIDCNMTTVYSDLNYQTVIAINCIYEAQLSPDICKQKLYSVFIEGHRLLPYNCMSISYFMSIASVTHLILPSCDIGDQEAEMFSKFTVLSPPSLQMLDLSNNYITHKGMKSIITIIRSSTKLTHFSASSNPIGNAGIQLFSLLKFKHLIQLNFFSIEITEVGTYALCECLELNNSLQSLQISYNYIKNGLTKINNLPSTLVQLFVSKCHLTYIDAENISKMLKINNTLKYLDISENSVGDDGILFIADSLRFDNATLIQLVARNCEFHSKGAEVVAIMLQSNKTLKYLNISNNDIRDYGIKVITFVIKANTTLIELIIFDCGFGRDSLGHVVEMLKINKSLNKLGITYNGADREVTFCVLHTFCLDTCNLKQLSIAESLVDYNKSVVMIKGYVNFYTSAANIVYYTEREMKNSKHPQIELTLHKKDEQNIDHATTDTDNTEEWLIDDDGQPFF